MERLKQALSAAGIAYKENEPLSAHCTFRIGGPADVFILPENEAQLCAAIKLAKEANIKYYLLGNGSNILFEDAGYRGAVINVSAMKSAIGILENICFPGKDPALTYDAVVVGADKMLSSLCMTALENSLTGLEFAYGIPGTVGGAVYMNAGAYGGEMKDVIESVVVYYVPTQALTEVRGSDCGFEYRRSGFEKINCAIMGAVFKLTPDDPEAIGARMKEMNEKRTASQPLDMPSAGSAFKRPVGGYAAALIDQCGLKGYTVGGAQISRKHAGFAVNTGSATYDDVVELLDHVAARSMRRHRLPSSRRYASTPRACCLLTTGARGSRPSSTVCSSRQSRMPQTRQPKAATFGRAERFGEKIYGVSYHNRTVRRRQEPGRGHN